jgi:hypothetical protein
MEGARTSYLADGTPVIDLTSPTIDLTSPNRRKAVSQKQGVIDGKGVRQRC